MLSSRLLETHDCLDGEGLPATVAEEITKETTAASILIPAIGGQLTRPNRLHVRSDRVAEDQA